VTSAERSHRRDALLTRRERFVGRSVVAPRLPTAILSERSAVEVPDRKLFRFREEQARGARDSNRRVRRAEDERHAVALARPAIARRTRACPKTGLPSLAAGIAGRRAVANDGSLMSTVSR
jgi:hypothetical protein